MRVRINLRRQAPDTALITAFQKNKPSSNSTRGSRKATSWSAIQALRGRQPHQATFALRVTELLSHVFVDSFKVNIVFFHLLVQRRTIDTE